eukprot:6213186-Pleurochrysis_carterae.AAC.1
MAPHAHNSTTPEAMADAAALQAVLEKISALEIVSTVSCFDTSKRPDEFNKRGVRVGFRCGALHARSQTVLKCSKKFPTLIAATKQLLSSVLAPSQHGSSECLAAASASLTAQAANTSSAAPVDAFARMGAGSLVDQRAVAARTLADEALK